ncbi:MAG: hypothetical protein H0T69_06010 [Thermoleophilaceae bacterium]|nr:hypothetical protein [Thermoleophilaceae bacterium]
MSGRRKTCRYHCRGDSGYKGCSRHFASLEAFDLHRQTLDNGQRVCVPPSAVRDSAGAPLLIRQTVGGECRVCPPYSNAVTVWTTGRSHRAAVAFNRPSALGAKRETAFKPSTEGSQDR